jgi:hypothetical protein
MIAADDDDIKCDQAEETGDAIMTKMDGIAVSDVVLKRKDQVRTLLEIEKKITVGGKSVNLDSSILFDRLLLIVERSPDIEVNFLYELTTTPMALFKDSCLRKTAKSSLAKVLIKGIDNSWNKFKASSPTYVLDGGCLLHKVKWSNSGTYSEVVSQYVTYVQKHFGLNCFIIFDGYCNGPTIKDHEHQKRAVKSCPDIDVEGNKPVYKNQAAFPHE